MSKKTDKLEIAEYSVDNFVSDKVLIAADKDMTQADCWEYELGSAACGYSNAGAYLQDIMIQGVMDSRAFPHFKVGLIRIYTAANKLDDGGKARQQIFNAFQRGMKICGKNLTIRHNHNKSAFIIAAPAKRPGNTRSQSWTFNKASEKVALTMHERDIVEEDLVKFFETAGFDADMLRFYADMLETK